MAPTGTGDLRAILSTTLALVEHFGDAEQHGAMLIGLKRTLEHAIGVLEADTECGHAISLRGFQKKRPSLGT